MVLYFSGTGNSRYLAEKISIVTNSKLINLNNLIKYNSKLVDDDNDVVLCCPTYAWRIPRIVSDFLKKSTFKKGAKIYFVMTCGTEIGGAFKHNKRLARKLRLKYMGTSEIIMPENYIAMFNTPSIEEEKKMLEDSKDKIDETVKCIIESKPLKAKSKLIYRILSDIGNPFFYLLFVNDKKFYAKDTCIDCGLCERLCPLNNIKLVDKKPKWSNNCTHCMACISYCPVEAIEYGDISKDKRRYYYGKN